MIPDVHHARHAGISIDYQVVGGPLADLVYLPGFSNNLKVIWVNHLFARYLGRLASFSRLVIVDHQPGGNEAA